MIVLNYEGERVLEDCVRSLLADMSDEDELIVVDNASTDGSGVRVAQAYPRVKLVALPENTYIFGLNEGLKVATGKYVAFLNNDMTVDRGFIDGCLDGFTSPEIFAVCPRILELGGAEQGSRTSGKWRGGLIFYTALPHSPEPTDCFFAVGGQSFFDHEKLQEIGSIDPLLRPMYHEDIELSYRAWKRGWVIRYAPDSVVRHVGGHSSRKVFTPTQLRSFVRQNEYLTVWKNVTDTRLLVEHFAALPFRLLVAALKRDMGTLRGFGRAVSRLPELRHARTEARKHMRLTDAAVLARVGAIR
nr:glycosyltransferase family 2 protein [Motilibacter deserti]